MTNDEFEDMAEQFYNETGYLAPGKDWPAARGGDPRGDYDTRLAKWTEWKQKRANKQPSKLACEIERQFAESKLVGPMRRLGDIVDECLKELRATIKCCGCNGWFAYSDLQPSSWHPEADPICNRCLDAEDWRKGVALVYAAIGEPDPPGLCCVTLAEKVLALRAALEEISQGIDCGCQIGVPHTWQSCPSYTQEALVIYSEWIQKTAKEAIAAGGRPGTHARPGDSAACGCGDAEAASYCADQLRAEGRPYLANLLAGLMKIAASKSDDPVLSNIEQGVRDGLARANHATS